MRIIDRYLLRQFLQVFAICFCSVTGLLIVFEAFDHLDSFMHAAETQGSLLGVMAEFYLYRTFYFFNLVSGMLALTSAIFTMLWIQRHNEMIALMAAGVSKVRIVTPVVIASIGISLLGLGNRELLMPSVRDKLARDPKDLLGDSAVDLQPRYDYETDVHLQGQLTYANEKRVNKPNFLLPKSLDGIGQQLLAADAYYHPPANDRPGGYLLKGVTQPKSLLSGASLTMDGKRIVITPHDEPQWLSPDEIFVVSNISFDQLTGGQTFLQFSSTRELITGLRNPSLGLLADARVKAHSRIVQPLLDVTLLFLGLPLVLGREQRNIFLSIGLCVAVTAVFMLTVILFQVLGSGYLLSPALSAWMPLLIFVPVAVALFDRLKR